MAEEGVQIPFEIETGDSVVTIEKLAARILSLEDATNKLTEAQKGSSKAAKDNAVTMGLVAGFVGKITEQITGRALRAWDDFTGSMGRAVAFGGKFQDMSAQFNTTAVSLQKLAAIGAPVGVGVEQIARSLNIVERNLGSSGKAFQKWGVNVQDLAKQDAAGKFQTLIKTIRDIDDPTKQAAASFELLKDRSGAFLKIARSDEIQQITKDFEDFGLAVSDNVVGALDALGDQQDTIGSIFTSMRNNFLGAVASSGALQEAVRVVTEVFGKLSKFVKDNEATIRNWTNAAVVFAADALVFLARNVLPFVIDQLTVLSLGLLGVKKVVDVVAASLKFFFEIVTKPTSFGTAFDTLKKRLVEIADEAVSGAGKIIDANATMQDKAGQAANVISTMRDRIVDAAGKSTDYSNKIKDASKSTGQLSEEAQKAAQAVADMARALQGIPDPKATATLGGALAAIGDASKIAKDQVAGVVKQILAARDAGQTFTGKANDVANAVLAIARGMEEAALATKEFEETLSGAEAIIGKLGDPNRIRAAFASLGEQFALAFGEALSPEALERLTDEQLAVVQKKIQDIAQAAAEAGLEIPGLFDLAAESFGKLQDRAERTIKVVAGAPKVTRDWAQELENVANLMQALPGLAGKLGQAFAAVAAGISGIGAGIESLKKGMKAGGGGLGGLFGGGLGNILGNLGTIGSIASAAFGIGKTIVDLFKSDPIKKAQKEAGKILGVGISRELAETIKKSADALKISIKSATLLALPQVIAESGKAASSFAKQANDLLTGIANGSIPAKEGLASLGQTFTAIADEALEAGRVGDRVMVGLIKRARELKIESPEMKAFVGAQLDASTAGVSKFIESLGSLSEEGVAKIGKDAGIIFGANFAALVEERGIVAAVDAMKDSFTTLRETLSESLGSEEASAILAPFAAAFDTIGNEKLRPIFEGIDGITQAMKGLANAGFLTVDQFSAMQRATKTLFDEAIAGGADTKTALQAIAPSIQAAIRAAEQFGVPLDADTQRLKELAEQNGITFSTDPQQAMLDVLVEIAKVLGADIPESARKAEKAIKDMADVSVGVGPGTPGTNIEGFSTGGAGLTGGSNGRKTVTANVVVNLGVNENPLAAADTAAAMRQATINWTAEAIQDRVPAIIAAIEGQAG